MAVWLHKATFLILIKQHAAILDLSLFAIPFMLVSLLGSLSCRILCLAFGE